MKTKLRSKVFKDIVNRICYVKGFDSSGAHKERWLVMDKNKKLNKTIECKEKKLNKTIECPQPPSLGDLVTHREHPIGLGLVVEKHKMLKAFRVKWIDQPLLNLFIDEKVLIPINKEHTHESDDL